MSSCVPFQPLNQGTDTHETWYEPCALGGHLSVIIPLFTNNSIVGAETYEVGATLTPLKVKSRSNVLLQILEKFANFV
jgi:hypothetical protein